MALLMGLAQLASTVRSITFFSREIEASFKQSTIALSICVGFVQTNNEPGVKREEGKERKPNTKTLKYRNSKSLLNALTH